MGLFGDIGGGIGDFIGNMSGGGADEAAKNFYNNLIAKYGKLDPKIVAQEVGPSALGTAGIEARGSQMDALRELQNEYRSGGLDAIGRSQMSEANAGANRNAQANRNSVVEQARARGSGRSGVTMALEQNAGQQAMGDSFDAAQGAAAGAEARQRGAAGQAAGVASGVRGQDYQAASAQDAINQFNASMRAGAQQATFGNEMAQLGAEGGAYSPVYNAGKSNEGRISRAWGGLGRMVGGAGDAIAGASGAPTGGFGGGGSPAAVNVDQEWKAPWAV